MLSDLSLQMFCALIEVIPPPPEPLAKLAEENIAVKGVLDYIRSLTKDEVPSTILSINEYQRLLIRIEGQPNYMFIFEGLSRLLSNFVTAKNTILPNSIKELKCYSEMIVLCLRIFTINPVISFQNRILLAFCYVCFVEGRF